MVHHPLKIDITDNKAERPSDQATHLLLDGKSGDILRPDMQYLISKTLSLKQLAASWVFLGETQQNAST